VFLSRKSYSQAAQQTEDTGGKMKYFAVSRQMVLFAVERRKAWRMLQSKAGVVNKDCPIDVIPHCA
jgi:hypothetical protein